MATEGTVHRAKDTRGQGGIVNERPPTWMLRRRFSGRTATASHAHCCAQATGYPHPPPDDAKGLAIPTKSRLKRRDLSGTSVTLRDKNTQHTAAQRSGRCRPQSGVCAAACCEAFSAPLTSRRIKSDGCQSTLNGQSSAEPDGPTA